MLLLQQVAYILIAFVAILLLLVKIILDRVNRKLREHIQRLIRHADSTSSVHSMSKLSHQMVGTNESAYQTLAAH